MERNGTFRELVQEEKRKLMNEEIFESAFYKEMLLSVAGELTGGTLKKVELVKFPESGWAGKCNTKRVLLNIENCVTASFPSVSLKSDSITGFLGHECGHWNFSDFKLRKKYLEGLKKGEWYLHPPNPATESEAEHLEEVNGYLEQKHEAAASLLAETASYIQNMLEDVYIEQKMCERYPGSIRRGIRQNRIRNAERIPSLKVQLESGYKPAAILLNLMAQYSLTGTVNNWEDIADRLLEILELVKPVIDTASTSEDAKMRMDATNRILLIIWEVLLEEIQEMEKQQNCQNAGSQEQKEAEDPSGESQNQPEGTDSQKEQEKQLENAEKPEYLKSRQRESQSRQERNGQPKESQNQNEAPQNKQEETGQPGVSKEKEKQNKQAGTQKQQERQEESQPDSKETVRQMIEQLRGQLPEFLLEKDGEDVEGNLQRMGEVSKVNALLPNEQVVETRDRLTEYIQEAAEELAKRELEDRFCLELSRELLATEFDGDHRKVKKILKRETKFSKSTRLRCTACEDQVRDIMRRMKPRLLPVLSCQGTAMERNLFFGSQMNYQALYDPGKRIFCNLEVRKKVNTAVALLIDMSGSMEGKRMKQARLCALCLYEFCRSAGIPILIYGHHTDNKQYKRVQNETVYLHSLAEFDADSNDKYRIAGIEADGCNRDGAAITFVGEKLAKRPEKIKLLFLISDGFPNASCYRGKEAEADLLQIKEKLEKKRITMLTAAIGEDKEAIQRIYKEGFLDISDLEQLPYILPKQILKYIRR